MLINALIKKNADPSLYAVKLKSFSKAAVNLTVHLQ